jgi:hypothetical protein
VHVRLRFAPLATDVNAVRGAIAMMEVVDGER